MGTDVTERGSAGIAHSKPLYYMKATDEPQRGSTGQKTFLCSRHSKKCFSNLSFHLKSYPVYRV